MKFTCLLLVNKTNRRLWQGIEHVPFPVETFVSAMVGNVKTVRGCQQMVVGLTQGELGVAALRMFFKFHVRGICSDTWFQVIKQTGSKEAEG